MVKRTGPTNKQLKELILELRKTKENIWERVAEMLEKPSRQRVEVNLWSLDNKVEPGEFVVVPGKVLGKGKVSKKFTVGAWQFSSTAEKKLEESKCDAITIPELIKKKPEGSGVRIIA